MVVQIALRNGGRILFGESTSDQLFGCGLAIASGNGQNHHSQFMTMVCCQSLKSLQGIGNQNVSWIPFGFLLIIGVRVVMAVADVTLLLILFVIKSVIVMMMPTGAGLRIDDWNDFRVVNNS